MELAVIQDVEEWINHQLISKLGDTLQSIYLVGSYPSGKVSLNRPDINWLLVWKGFVSGIDLWTLGEILTSTIEKFRQGVVIRPEFRPFKFSYPIERGKDECFVNITVVSGAATTEDFKKKNSFVPEYVFSGFKDSRKLIWGEDTLSNMEFAVSADEIKRGAMQKIMSHKIQLDRIPLVYHIKRDSDLIFSESITHGKNLLYFATELVMNNEELKASKHLALFHDNAELIQFIKERFPQIENEAQTIIDGKSNYPKWKQEPDKARLIYLAASTMAAEMTKRAIAS